MTSQNGPATLTKPSVNTNVRMYGNPSHYTSACAARTQKKAIAQKTVISFSLPLRCATTTSAANGANTSTALR